jgi:hypothetical protein
LSHFILLANFARGVSKQRPRRAISGAVAFLPHVSATFDARRAHARVDSVRTESAAGVKKRALRAFWTAFALSLLARGERGTESV